MSKEKEIRWPTEEERVWHKLTNHFVGCDGGPPCWADGTEMTLEQQKWVLDTQARLREQYPDV